MAMNRKTRETLAYILSHAWGFISAPHPSVGEIGERRRAQLLSTLTLILTGAFIWGFLANPTAIQTFLALTFTTLISYISSRTRFYRAGIYLFSYGLSSIGYLSLFLGTASGFNTSITSTGHISIIVASILLSLRGFVVLAVLTIIATFAAPLYSQTPIDIASGFFREAGVYMSIGILLAGAIAFRNRIEQDRLQEISAVNKELEDLTANLENRVNERTVELEAANQQTSRRATQLQAITELSETIAQLKDLNTLFSTTTDLISERFGFYHVGIFWVDTNQEYAILQAANSEGGQRMLARSHRLKLGIGVVGFAAQSGKPRIALDVGADAVFFDNPDLPTTRSEVALPMKSRGETIGVLDVQSTESGAFTSDDLQVLTALANQVAIAIENARLLTDTRAALAQVREVYDEFTRTEWARTVSSAEQPGFRYQNGRIEIVEDELQTPEVVSAVEKGSTVANQAEGSDKKRAAVAVPVKLRGEVIGVLHIESNDPSREWQEDEISLVEVVAERAAFAMENARLFQDARRRAAKEQLISEASTKIGSALNLENILQTTAEELERVLGGSEILIQFQNKEHS